MTIPRLKLNVGKVSATGSVYPWEPYYVRSMREQMQPIQKAILSMLRQFEDATPAVLEEVLNPTLDKAVGYCPEETGALRGSAYLESVGFRGSPRVEMGFGKGGNPHYAVIVHENLDMLHMAPTRAKFLEEALNEDLPDMPKRIDRAYREFAGGL